MKPGISPSGKQALLIVVDMTVLPRIVASHEVIGSVTAEMAGACGLPAGTGLTGTRRFLSP